MSHLVQASSTIWLESKKRLPEYLAKEPANIGLRSHYSIRLPADLHRQVEPYAD